MNSLLHLQKSSFGVDFWHARQRRPSSISNSEVKNKQNGNHPAAYWINVLSRTVCVVTSETGNRKAVLKNQSVVFSFFLLYCRLFSHGELITLLFHISISAARSVCVNLLPVQETWNGLQQSMILFLLDCAGCRWWKKESYPALWSVATICYNRLVCEQIKSMIQLQKNSTSFWTCKSSAQICRYHDRSNFEIWTILCLRLLEFNGNGTRKREANSSCEVSSCL